MTMKTYRHKVSVHWGDTDPARIVFYPNYYIWFDQSTRLLFDSVGLDWDHLQAKYGVPGCPLVETHARYILPSRFRDELEIESRITEWHAKTFKVSHTVHNAGKVAVEGYEMRVWIGPHPDDPERMKAYPIPTEVRAAFELR
jgi:4-hydroxybenzoyl-CoA thioesterase